MSKYFKGFKISADGEEFGKVDLAAFASTFSHIECGEEMLREYAHVLVNGSETYYFDEDGNIVDGDGEFRKEIMSYEIVDIEKYGKDNATIKNYLNDKNEFTLEGMKTLYTTLGATCE